MIARATAHTRAGVSLAALVLGLALLAPWLAPFDPTLAVGPPSSAPSRQHWLGTNDIATLDRRHFTVVRSSIGALNLLP